MAKLFLGNSLRKYADRSPTLRNLMWRLEALMLAVFWKVSAWLSIDRASAAGRWLLKTLGPRSHKSRHFKRNLSLAFPDKPEAEIDALIQEAWGNVGAVIAEYPHLKAICKPETQRIEIVVKGDIQALLQGGKPAIFVSAHLANWEVCPASAVLLGFPVTVIYTPLQNPWLDRLLLRQRQTVGYNPVSKDDGLRQMMRELAKGRSIGLIVDQRVDSGEPIPLFGLDKLTTVVPARLALRFGCELVPIRAERLPGTRFRVTFYEPVKPDNEASDENQQVLQMMTQVNAIFESWIREQPHEWLCSKRRWAKTAVPRSGT